MIQENNSAFLKTMAEEIRRIYKSNPSVSGEIIELYLKENFKELPADEQLSLTRELAHQFDSPVDSPADNPVDMPDAGILPSSSVISKGVQAGFSEKREYSHLFTLLFGKNISKFDLSSEEHLEKLAKSLNTIFDTLNQIIGVIHTTLLGEQSELETIRHIIGSDIESQTRADSLQNYLDQIRRAFLVAHLAYQQSSKNKITQILDELSPEKIAGESKSILKFGSMKKAELYEIYEEKYQACMGWLASGRLMEELLREFEKICQKLYYNVDKNGL